MIEAPTKKLSPAIVVSHTGLSEGRKLLSQPLRYIIVGTWEEQIIAKGWAMECRETLCSVVTSNIVKRDSWLMVDIHGNVMESWV